MLTTAVLTGLAAHPGWGMGGVGFGWLFLLIPLFWIIVVVALVAVFGRRWRRGWYAEGPYAHPNGPFGAGQADAPPAHHQRLAELLLHALDLVAERRLRHV